MSKSERLINDYENLTDEELLENRSIYDIFEYMIEMEEAMLLFIDRVENGEILSTKTYNSFKAILEI